MSKWFNLSTGLEVPAAEVREQTAGSGIFVHETTTAPTAQLMINRSGREARTITIGQPIARKVVDGYAVKLADNEAFDPNVNYLGNQALASQAALRARGGV